ncbi:hypothetical protein COLO4_29996 [Corchorus olitorius]|uniref:Uncharacterized protein n=1 Tax=Corchorus olitorius TaxID=93759 RepID=A0A1R3HBS1_9ROSI|nr:hypothetical protein COLO4_29996 [Corchorus olitorius]
MVAAWPEDRGSAVIGVLVEGKYRVWMQIVLNMIFIELSRLPLKTGNI